MSIKELGEFIYNVQTRKDNGETQSSVNLDDLLDVLQELYELKTA